MFFNNNKNNQSYVNRPIENFKGDGAVIGCTNHPNFKCNHQGIHDDASRFYTIDYDASKSPDFVFDLTGVLPANLQNRFKLVVTENLDVYAYNANTPRSKGNLGFNNLLDMTDNDGFILIIGNPRWKEYRKEVTSRNLKYIEITQGNNDDCCILIPKNQTLDIQQVQSQIAQLDKTLQDTVTNAMGFYETTKPAAFAFCDIPYNEMPTMREALGFEKPKTRASRKIKSSTSVETVEPNSNKKDGSSQTGIIAHSVPKWKVSFDVPNFLKDILKYRHPFLFTRSASSMIDLTTPRSVQLSSVRRKS